MFRSAQNFVNILRITNRGIYRSKCVCLCDTCFQSISFLVTKWLNSTETYIKNRTIKNCVFWTVKPFVSFRQSRNRTSWERESYHLDRKNVCECWIFFDWTLTFFIITWLLGCLEISEEKSDISHVNLFNSKNQHLSVYFADLDCWKQNVLELFIYSLFDCIIWCYRFNVLKKQTQKNVSVI